MIEAFNIWHRGKRKSSKQTSMKNFRNHWFIHCHIFCSGVRIASHTVSESKNLVRISSTPQTKFLMASVSVHVRIPRLLRSKVRIPSCTLSESIGGGPDNRTSTDIETPVYKSTEKKLSKMPKIEIVYAFKNKL
jgi:hypothetical protein